MKFLKTIAPFATAASIAAIFAACGDSSSSDDSKDVKTPEYETAEDMIHCTKSHYGEFAYVKDEDAYYECTADGWVISDSSAVEEARSSSSVKDDLDDKSSSSVSAADTAAVNVEKVDSAKVVGFAQKGPFVNGSVVTVYGLDSALNTTSEKFTGKVVGDSGYFKVDGISLNSQFALVEANGFYKNAVTGKNTSGSKTQLNAIVDLSAKDVKANVNILTELEYARVVQLVTKEKFNVPAAKVKATKEILGLFGVTVDGEISASEISLADTNKAGVALYAASIALQGDLSASKFNGRLSDIAEDFAADGKWDDGETRAAVADYLSDVDSLDGFPAIRKNVEAMKLSAKVPEYESSLYAFWTGVFDLGTCDGDKETTIAKNKNKNSAYYGSGYVCVNNRWHKTTALDTELGLCLSKREGELAKDTTGKSTLYYVCQAGAWKNISDVDYELKLCNENRLGEVKSTAAKVGYVCRDNAWEKASAEDMELGFGCIESKRNKVFKSSAGNYFICKDGTWNASNAIISALGECTTEKAEALEKGVVDKAYYLCEKEGWTEVSKAVYDNGYCTEDRLNEYAAGFVCGTDDWREATTAEMTTEKVCVESLVNNVLNGYVCESEGWRDATAAEVATEKVCNASNDSTFVNGYACVKGAWREETAGEKANGDKFCVKSLYNTVSEGYACVDGAWRESKAGEDETGKVCTSSLINTLSGDYKLKCTADGWKEASAEEKATHAVCRSSNGYKVVNGYACDYDSKKTSWYWRTATEVELLESAVCNKDVAGTVKKGYTCVYENEAFGWRESTEGETATGTVCYSENSNQVKNGYACEKSVGSSYDWRTATELEIIGNSVCNSTIANQWRGDTLSTSTTVICQENGSWRYATEGEVATKKNCDYDLKDKVLKGYVCTYNRIKDQYRWREADAGENATGKLCTSANVDEVYRYIFGDTIAYTCALSGTYAWRESTPGERIMRKVCNSSIDSTVNVVPALTYVGTYACKNGTWYEADAGEKATGKVCTSKRNWRTSSIKFYANKDTTELYYCNSNTSGSFSWKKLDDGYKLNAVYDANGEKYVMVGIGGQNWMSRNLNYSTSGKSVQTATDSSRCYQEKSENCDTYGRQYDFSLAVKACPAGTHLPSHYEWLKLKSYIASSKNDSGNEGRYLKTSSGWNNFPGFDSYGFSALAGGYYIQSLNNSFYDISCSDVSRGKGDETFFWASYYKPGYALYARLGQSHGLDISNSPEQGSRLRNVRCPNSNQSTDGLGYAYVRCLQDFYSYGEDDGL